jgi:two-component system, cell cycle sensor histidine kinase and response regulator CckA
MTQSLVRGSGSLNTDPSQQAGEGQFHLMVGLLPDLFYRLSPAGELLWANPATANTLACAPNELIGKTFETAFPPNLTGQSWESIAAHLQRHQRLVFEHPLPGSASNRWFETRLCLAAATPDGRAEIMGVTREIGAPERTDKRFQRVEQALRLFEYCIEAAPESVHWLGPDGKVLYANQTMCRTLGYSKAELESLHLWEIDPTYGQDRFAAEWASYQVDRRGGGVFIETTHRRKDGTLIAVEVLSKHIWIGDLELHVAFARDITERRQAEQQIRHLNRLYAVLCHVNQLTVRASDVPSMVAQTCSLAAAQGDFPLVCIAQFSPDRRSLSFAGIAGTDHHLIERLRQYAPPRLIPRLLPTVDWTEQRSLLLAANHLQSLPAPWGEMARAAELRAATVVPIRSGGQVWGVIGFAARDPDYFGDREQELVREVGLDLGCGIENLERESERQRLQHLIRASEERYRSLVETTNDWIWEIDAGCRYTYASSKVQDLLGYPPEEVLGRTPFELMPSGEADRVKVMFANILARRQPFAMLENTNRHRDGRLVILETSGVPVLGPTGAFQGFRGIDRDVTERKRLEAQLLQAQRMEAVGQLAGGVAHDFNNILAAMMLQLGLLQSQSRLDPHTRNALGDLETQASRAANLTRQLLLFGRRSVMEIRSLALNTVILDLLKMLCPLLGEHIQIDFHRHEPLPPIEGDAGMIEQVLMNLAVNARDAMPNGGRLLIQTEVVELTANLTDSETDHPPGTYVRLSVSDTGAGMDQSTIKRIFEPFFTTKDVGKGSGLGLATVYGIVRQHQGWLEVESAPGEGSTFRVWFPATSRPLPPPSSPPPLAPAAGGHETLLLVEDEPSVRQFTAECLRLFGYQVLEAINAAQALAIWRLHAREIALLFTDMVMPGGTTGLELAEQLHAEKPALKVILCTGYSTELAQHDREHLRGVVYLQKPFGQTVLGAVVRACLDGQPIPLPGH